MPSPLQIIRSLVQPRRSDTGMWHSAEQTRDMALLMQYCALSATDWCCVQMLGWTLDGNPREARIGEFVFTRIITRSICHGTDAGRMISTEAC